MNVSVMWIVIIGFLLVAIILLALKCASLKKNITVLTKEKESLQSELTNVNGENKLLTEDNARLKVRNQELEVYSTALDADKEAAERLEKAKNEASDIVSAAQEKASSMISSAQEEASGLINSAQP